MKKSFCSAVAIHGLLFIASPSLHTAAYGMRSGVDGAATTLVVSLVEAPPPEASTVISVPEQPAEAAIAIEKKRPLKKPAMKKKVAVQQPAAQATTPSETLGAQSGAVQSGSPARPRLTEADYLSNPPPLYPSESRRRGEEGAVLLRVAVSTEGKVNALEVIQSSGHSRLDQAATQAVRRWRFRPPSVAGIPMSTEVEVPINFKLT